MNTINKLKHLENAIIKKFFIYLVIFIYIQYINFHYYIFSITKIWNKLIMPWKIGKISIQAEILKNIIK